MSTKLDHLKRAATDQDPKFDIDWSGITAQALNDGTVWIADQLPPDLGIAASDIINATKTLVFGSQDGSSRLITQVTLGQNAPPSTDSLAKLFAADAPPPPGYYTMLGISKFGQNVNAVVQNGGGDPQTIPVLLTGNLAYQYECVQGSNAQRKAYLDALAAGDPSSVFIDLYPSNVSAVVQSDYSKTYSLQHAQPRTIPSPALLQQANLPLMQGLMCIDGPATSYNGWMDITNAVAGLADSQSVQSKRTQRPMGLNINLNAGDIATIIGVLAGASVATREKSGKMSAKNMTGFGSISVGISIAI
jgi:hypothetical protein